jgi:hypothetical protein
VLVLNIMANFSLFILSAVSRTTASTYRRRSESVVNDITQGIMFRGMSNQVRLYTFEGPSAKLMMWIHKWICTQTINHIWACQGTCNRQSWCKFGYMGQRCCFPYF